MEDRVTAWRLYDISAHMSTPRYLPLAKFTKWKTRLYFGHIRTASLFSSLYLRTTDINLYIPSRRLSGVLHRPLLSYQFSPMPPFTQSAAVLSVLPPHYPPRVQQDQVHRLHRAGILDKNTMNVLDSLAAVCVRDPSDVFATTVEFLPTTLKLFVASNRSLTDTSEAIQRVLAVWQHLQQANLNERNMGQLRSAVGMDESTVQLHNKFVAAQYRYSWNAVNHRLSHDIPEVLVALSRFLADSPVPRAKRVFTPGFVGTPDDNRELLERLSQNLVAVQKTIKGAVPSDYDLLVLHHVMKTAKEDIKAVLVDNERQHVLFHAARASTLSPYMIYWNYI